MKNTLSIKILAYGYTNLRPNRDEITIFETHF